MNFENVCNDEDQIDNNDFKSKMKNFDSSEETLNSNVTHDDNKVSFENFNLF